MFLVHVGRDLNLIAGKLLRSEAQGQAVGGLGRDAFLRREGLYEVIVHSPVGLVIAKLRVHHLPEGVVAHTVDAGAELVTVADRFEILCAVGQDIPAGTKFEDLPDDWRCPRCKRKKEKFKAL